MKPFFKPEDFVNVTTGCDYPDLKTISEVAACIANEKLEREWTIVYGRSANLNDIEAIKKYSLTHLSLDPAAQNFSATLINIQPHGRLKRAVKGETHL